MIPFEFDVTGVKNATYLLTTRGGIYVWIRSLVWSLASGCFCQNKVPFYLELLIKQFFLPNLDNSLLFCFTTVYISHFRSPSVFPRPENGRECSCTCLVVSFCLRLSM